MTTPTNFNHDAEEREFLNRHALAIRELRERAGACPHPDVLSAMAMGVLPEEAVAGIQAHVASCPLCAALNETFMDAAAEDAAESAVAPPDTLWGRVAPKRRKRWLAWPFALPLGVPQWAPVAALALVTVGIGFFALRFREPPPQIAENRPPLIAQTFALPVEKAPLRLPLEALVWRAAPESPSDKYFADLGKALEPYNRDGFAEAAKTLQELEARYPEAVEPAFYLGVSYLMLDRSGDALSAFERARRAGGGALAPDIEWYTAVASERQGRIEESRRILKELCASDGPYHDSACSMVPRLESAKP